MQLKILKMWNTAFLVQVDTIEENSSIRYVQNLLQTLSKLKTMFIFLLFHLFYFTSVTLMNNEQS